MSPCRLCASPQTEILLDFGQQPLCNHYPASADAIEPVFALALMLCRACGVTQLQAPPPLTALADYPAWITYREAERHLDEVAELILRTAALSPVARIRGLSFKDAPLLERLVAKGFGDARLYTSEELGLAPNRTGIESLQAALTPERAAALCATDGPCDLLLARHLLEHTQHLASFIAGLAGLLGPSGQLLLELPDSSRSLALGDYSMPWEEHVFYFTPTSLRQVWRHFGWFEAAYQSFDYLPEDVQVALIRPGKPADLADPTADCELALGYAAGLEPAKAQVARTLKAHAPAPVVLLGAGHLGATFINLLGLADSLTAVLDDDPHKQGLFMPGSRLPILPSAYLRQTQVGLCLLSINPESEARVIERFAHLRAAGTEFASVFPGSRFKLKRDDPR